MTNTTATIFENISRAGTISPTTLNGLPGMSSLEIAEITGKNHKHVLRDIQKMLKELGLEEGPDLGSPIQWVETKYLTAQNKALPMVILDKRRTFTLLSRYSFKLADLIVGRWVELEGSGFERVSVQAAVVHLVEREKDNQRDAHHAIRKAIKKAPKRPLSPAAKERQKLLRHAKAYENTNPMC